MALFITTNAESLDEAIERTDEQAAAFVQLMSYVSNFDFKVLRCLHVTDWTAGLVIREQFVFGDAGAAPPTPVLRRELLETAQLFETWGISPTIARALRWFAAAVRSTIMEDQFQYFWFVVELLAVALGDRTKVTDKCVHCAGDLRCDACGKVSTHRPFEKQKIEMLLLRCRIHPQVVKDLFYVRNALMHGTQSDAIEEEIKSRDAAFSFDRAVDAIGRAAWEAIFDSFEKPAGPHPVNVIAVSTYVNWRSIPGAHVQVSLRGNPGEPSPEDVHPLVSVKLNYAQEPIQLPR